MTYSTTFLTALCSSALLSRLQHVQAEILQGCAAVHCPNRYADMLSPTCQVVDTDMRLIGLMNTQSDLVNDLTWTVGDSGLQNTIAGDERTVTRSLYLGTPNSVDLTSSNLSFKGCAIFVVSPETGAYQVDGQGAPQFTSTASCVGSMGENCVEDLYAKVVELARSSADSDVSAFCKTIAVSLQDNPPSSCYIFSQQPRLEAVALTGPDAKQVITSSDNSTSNCWPTLPKTNDLTKVFEYDHVAQLNQTVPWLGYTPLINVLAPVGNNTDKDVEVNLACMKIVDSDDFSLGTASNGSRTDEGDGKEGSAATLKIDLMGVALFVSAWIVALV